MAFLLGIVFSLVAGLTLASAMIVEKVGSDGRLTLEDGNQVSLAGIKMDAEGASILRVLAEKQNVQIVILKTVQDDKGGNSVYAYLNAKSITLPFTESGLEGQEEILLNRFLVRLGAAKVDETQEFAKKDEFLKVQSEAKKKGEGVWSYEDF